MFAHLYKDWMTGRLFVLVLLPFYLFYGLAAHLAAGVFLLFHILLAILLIVGQLAVEEKYRSAEWICALPVRRNSLVAARYLSALVIMALLFALYCGYGALLQWLIPRPQLITGVAGIALYWPWPMIFVALLFPLYFRYGLSGGARRILFGSVLLLVILTLAARALPRFSSLWPPLAGWHSPAGVWQTAAAALQNGRLADPVTLLLWLVLPGVILTFSVIISRRIFRRQEL